MWLMGVFVQALRRSVHGKHPGRPLLLHWYLAIGHRAARYLSGRHEQSSAHRAITNRKHPRTLPRPRLGRVHGRDGCKCLANARYPVVGLPLAAAKHCIHTATSGHIELDHLCKVVNNKYLNHELSYLSDANSSDTAGTNF